MIVFPRGVLRAGDHVFGPVVAGPGDTVAFEAERIAWPSCAFDVLRLGVEMLDGGDWRELAHFTAPGGELLSAGGILGMSALQVGPLPQAGRFAFRLCAQARVPLTTELRLAVV